MKDQILAELLADMKHSASEIDKAEAGMRESLEQIDKPVGFELTDIAHEYLQRAKEHFDSCRRILVVLRNQGIQNPKLDEIYRFVEGRLTLEAECVEYWNGVLKKSMS